MFSVIFLLVVQMSVMINSKSVIQTMVQGNISDHWNFNLTMFAKDLKGILFYGADSNLNKLSIRVTMSVKNKKYMQLTYNNVFTRPSLLQICGCDPCDDKIINVYLMLRTTDILLRCNGYDQDTLIKSTIRDTIPQFVLESLKKTSNSMFIGMGNVDDSDELIGCLHSFTLNKTQLKFTASGTELLPSCKVKCSEGMCNMGKCRVPYPPGPFCDCSGTALNGRYCNRTLKIYNSSDLHSYQRKTILKPVQLKLTWQPSFKKTYCLMEVIYGTSHVTFSITEDHLMKNIEIVSPITWDEINFINVNMSDSHLIITILNKNFQIDLPLSQRFKVNVGFTEKDAKCETFQGKYDIFYNKTQLIRFDPTVMKKVNILWIIIPIVCIILILCAIGLVIFILRRMKKDESTPEKELENLNPDQDKTLHPKIPGL